MESSFCPSVRPSVIFPYETTRQNSMKFDVGDYKTNCWKNYVWFLSVKYKP